MFRIRALPCALVLAGAVLLGACEDEDPTGPSADVVAGTYTATRLNVTESGATHDILDLGGTLTMTLNANGSTSGTLFVPGGDEDGNDFLADLTGTWVIRNDRIEFDHTADTFLRDVSFQFDNGRLITTEATSDTQFDVILTRS